MADGLGFGAACRTPQRIRCGVAAHPRPNLGVDVPDEPVFGCPSGRSYRADRVLAVHRIVQRQRVRHRQRSVADRIEVLQRIDRDGLSRDAYPDVAVGHDLAVHHRPADVEVKGVRWVQYLDDDIAAEWRAVRRPPDEHAGGIRGVRRADNGRTRRGPRIDVGRAADQVFLFEVADFTEVLGDHLVIGGPERIGIHGDRERPYDRG